MIVTFVHVWVKEAFIDEFIKVSIENQENTLKEPGNIRFDLLRDAEDKSKFVFYEVFRNSSAIDEHKKTNHYIRWRDTVADWMLQPRQGIKHSVVSPIDESQW